MKSGVRISGVDSVDHYVWLTCCALHNWLLDIDGLSEKWVGGVRQYVSDWEGELGGIVFDGIHKDIPNALARLSNNLDARNYDLSGLGPGLDVIGKTRTIFTQEISDDACNEVLKQICVGEVFDMFNFSLWQYSDDYSSIILPFYLVRTKSCGQREKRREGENRMIDT